MRRKAAEIHSTATSANTPLSLGSNRRSQLRHLFDVSHGSSSASSFLNKIEVLVIIADWGKRPVNVLCAAFPLYRRRRERQANDPTLR